MQKILKYLQPILIYNKYLFLIIGILLLHFLISYLTVSSFPKISLEEPNYTVSGYNLMMHGKRINDYFNGLNWTIGYKAYWGSIETFPPLYPYTVSAYLQIFPYKLIPLRLLSTFAGALLLLAFIILSKRIFNYKIVLFLSLILTTSYIFRFITQQARPDIFVSVSSIVSVLFLVKYYFNKQLIFILLASLFASIAFLFHISGLIVIFGFYLTTSVLLIKRDISWKHLFASFGISFLLLFPYIFFVIKNFEYFKIQVLFSAGSEAVSGFSWLFAHKEGLLIVIFIAITGVLSIFLSKLSRIYKLLCIYYLCVFGIGFLLQIKIRYSLIYFPISLLFFTASVQYISIKWHKPQLLFYILSGIAIISSSHFILDALKYSKKENSYWSIIEEIDKIIPNNAKIIGHPNFLWGMNKVNLKITECSEPDVLLNSLESYDFIVANETWQKRMLADCWTPEIMEKLNLVYSRKNEIYDFKVYKILKSEIPDKLIP